ncbi:MAG: M20 family metallopeptidase [Synergistaceae bacterium]|jgi:succinyl-diaminopimelate desuccinylase|nr:M20 family metallopeptidase [Synergistaceae bacterium]
MPVNFADRESAKTILEQLVRIRTPQPAGDEKDAALFLWDLFKAYPMERILLDHGGNRASLIVTLPGRDRSRSVVIAGHLDTVGVNPADKWEHAPFSAFFDGERIYGRGSADMKGGVTSIVLAALSLLRDRFCPETDVQFCFTADEEVGGIGAKALCDGGYLDKATEIVVVKPTGERIGLAEKGALWLEVTAKGRCAHAAIPESGVNAVDQIVSFAQNISSWLKKKGKYSLLGYSTCTITNLHGGLYPNVVPDYAEAFLDIRTSPNIVHTDLLQKIHALLEEQVRENPPLALDFEVKADRPALGMDEDAPLVRRFARIYEELRCPWETVGIRYFTDTSIFVPRLGIPFVIIGPGEEIFFHQPDEYISLASVTRMAGVLNAYLKTTA